MRRAPDCNELHVWQQYNTAHPRIQDCFTTRDRTIAKNSSTKPALSVMQKYCSIITYPTLYVNVGSDCHPDKKSPNPGITGRHSIIADIALIKQCIFWTKNKVIQMP